jgi:ATPase
MKVKKIVPDTSILIQGKLSQLIKEGKIKKAKIIIPKAVVDELQAQASRGREIGFTGLEEIKKLRAFSEEKKIKLEFTGQRPTLEEIQLAKKGRIDAIIRDVAAKENAVLITGDYVQALVGEAEGVKVEHIPHPVKKRVKIESFFTKDTQSVHLKAGVPPMAKIGKPGNVSLVKIRETPCDEDEIKSIINEIMHKVRIDENSFIEIGKNDAIVVQMGEYRISIAKPPFSDGLELTAVRPIVKLGLNDYKLHKELEKGLVDKSKGILIAGPPGSGKTSFASALAEFLVKQGKIVKTFEQPRDLQVGPEVTQYAPLEGDWNKTAELLLLVRPDYTIFDEIRHTKDFRVFGDMRLAGVGMIGVIHSTDPVSAIQRFIGRVELGMIPHVIDTVIYIKDGKIHKVYDLTLTVKIPTGMKEADLARPVVEIRDFETKELEYEIYTYGEENVIIPVKHEKESPLRKLAKEKIINELRKFDSSPEVEFLSDDRILVRIRNDAIAKMIGKKGKTIEKIEEKLGIRITVEPKETTLKGSIEWGFEETGAYLNIIVPRELTGKQIDVYNGDEYIFSPFVGKKGYIKVKKNSELGKRILTAIASEQLRVLA